MIIAMDHGLHSAMIKSYTTCTLLLIIQKTIDVKNCALNHCDAVLHAMSLLYVATIVNTRTTKLNPETKTQEPATTAGRTLRENKIEIKALLKHV